MNPILQSRIRMLIRGRKNYLYERDDMEPSHRMALLRRINEDIISVIDRSLLLLGASPYAKRKRGYRVKPIVVARPADRPTVKP